MTPRILLFLFIAALFASCSSSGKMKNDPNSQRLIFGNGGGFTGIYTSYELFENGHVFALQPDSTLLPVKKIRKKQTRDIFEQADKLKITQPAFNYPGNMSSFIKYQAVGVSTEYKWGDPGAYVPIEIKEFYIKLNAIVK